VTVQKPIPAPIPPPTPRRFIPARCRLARWRCLQKPLRQRKNSRYGCSS
jgi:hypothetical protein